MKHKLRKEFVLQNISWFKTLKCDYLLLFFI